MSGQIKPVGFGGLPPRRDELPPELELKDEEVAKSDPLPRWGSKGGSAINNPHQIESVFDDLDHKDVGNNALSDRVTSRIELIKSLIDKRLVDGKIVLFVRDDNPSLHQYVAHYTKAKVEFDKLLAEGYPLVLVPNSLMSALEQPIELQQVPAIVVYENRQVVGIKYAYMHEEGVEEFLYNKLGRTGESPFIIDESADVPTPKAASEMGPFTVSPQDVPKKESPFTIAEDGPRDPNEILPVAKIVTAQTPIYKIPLNPLSEDIFRIDSPPSLVSKVFGAVSAWLSREVPARTAAVTGGPSAEKLAEISAERPNPSLKETFVPAIAAFASMLPAFKARLSNSYEPDLSSHDKPTFIESNETAKKVVKSAGAFVEGVGDGTNFVIDKFAEKTLVPIDYTKKVPKSPLVQAGLASTAAAVVAWFSGLALLSNNDSEKGTPQQPKDNGGEVASVEKAEAAPEVERVENIIKLPQPEKVDFDAKYSDRLKVEAPSGVAYYIQSGDIVKTFDGKENPSDIADILSSVNVVAINDKALAKEMLMKVISENKDGGRELTPEQIKDVSTWFNANKGKLDEQVKSRAVGE